MATGDLFTVGTESATPAAPTLGVPVTSSAGAAAASPVVTDFDGDGHADVALVDAAAGDVRVLAGAAGGFGAPQVFAGGGGELASGDFDGDGVTDLLVARPDQSAVACLAGMCPPLASASVALRARHDGERFVTGFARRIAWSRESGIALARVELSRDGGMHWVTLAEASADTALAWIVTGPATAHARLRVSDAANPSRADVSGEFAIVAPYGTPRSDAWPGSGTGASALALGASHVATVAAGRVLVAPLGGGAWTDAGEADARSVVFADCDGDGREDLVTRLANFVSVRRALEAGGFGEARMLGTAGANAALVAADFDLDGRADLAVACGTPPAQRVTFRATAAADDGRAAFAAPGAVALPAAATALVATDVNADGITDLLAGGNGVLATLLGNGTAGRGDGSFRLGATRGFGGGALAALLATDLDRDGATDVAGVDATGTVLGAAGNGAGGFGTPVAFATAAAARALAWWRLRPRRRAGPAVGGDGGVTLLRGTARIAAGAFAAAGTPLARACALAACDPDADGVADLLVLDDAAAALRVLPGNLAREREPALTPPAAGAPALGASLTLHWSALDAADLDLSYDDGAHWVALARGVTGGAWRWNVTGAPTGLARLRVRDAFAPVRGDTTAVFAIAPAALGVEAGPAPALALAAPWPNPARGAVTLAFALPRAGGATLEICDVGGRRVRTLHTGTLAAGRHAFAWDGRDDAGGAAPAGVYFAALRTAGARTTREFVLAR
ncbi:MAG: FlgD immunoglobulin-like domain containing protein [Candidatus Eisenbacteria bacterium]